MPTNQLQVQLMNSRCWQRYYLKRKIKKNFLKNVSTTRTTMEKKMLFFLRSPFSSSVVTDMNSHHSTRGRRCKLGSVDAQMPCLSRSTLQPSTKGNAMTTATTTTTATITTTTTTTKTLQETAHLLWRGGIHLLRTLISYSYADSRPEDKIKVELEQKRSNFVLQLKQ